MAVRFVAGVPAPGLYLCDRIMLRALVHAHASGWSALALSRVGAGIVFPQASLSFCSIEARRPLGAGGRLAVLPRWWRCQPPPC